MALETFEFLLVKDFTTPTTTYTERLFNFPATGLTLITALNRNTIIREVGIAGFCFQNRTSTNSGNKGFQINNYQMEYSIVGFDGQFMNVKGGNANLFVPNPLISVLGTPYESAVINEVTPYHKHCTFGGGIIIQNLAFGIQQFTGSGLPSKAEFKIYVTYEV